MIQTIEQQAKRKAYRSLRSKENSAYSLAYAAAHPEETSARMKKWRSEHKEEISAYNKEYSKNHPKDKSSYIKQYQLDNPEKVKKWRQTANLRQYGLTIKDYDNLFEEQGGRCAICDRHQSELKTPLHVDHDHEDGNIRGLLCHRCNLMLGLGKDNSKLLRIAADYLEKE